MQPRSPGCFTTPELLCVCAGACNPKIAHAVLTRVPDLGVHLPCNVVVTVDDAGHTVVETMDPLQMAVHAPEIAEHATDVHARLQRVLLAVRE